jgi:hypothetical protein
MADACVTRQGLHVVNAARRRPANQSTLDTAMLIAQGDLQMMYMLAMTLEPKVAGLDDTGMHRTDGYLVNFLAGHLEERCHRGRNRAFRGTTPRILAGNLRSVIPQRLEPGVLLRLNPELFGDFAFERLGGGTLRSQGGIALAHLCGRQFERTTVTTGNDGYQAHHSGRPWLTEQRGNAATAFDQMQNSGSEVIHIKLGEIGPIRRLPGHQAQ